MTSDDDQDQIPGLTAFSQMASSSHLPLNLNFSHSPTPHPINQQTGGIDPAQWNASTQQPNAPEGHQQNQSLLHSQQPNFLSPLDAQWQNQSSQMSQLPNGFNFAHPNGLNFQLSQEMLLEALRNSSDIQPQDEPLIIDALVEANHAGHSYKVALNGLHGVCSTILFQL
jgi:hypothetical protein